MACRQAPARSHRGTTPGRPHLDRVLPRVATKRPGGRSSLMESPAAVKSLRGHSSAFASPRQPRASPT
jgi:hypothetical protein